MSSPKTKLKAFNIFYSSLIIFIFGVIAVANFFKAGQAGYNQITLIIYGMGAVVAGFGTLIFHYFRSVKEDSPFSAGFISETSPKLSVGISLARKFVPHIIWTLVIIFLSLGGMQKMFPDVSQASIWGSPDMYSNIGEFATAPGDVMAVQKHGLLTTLWDIAINPGMTEDGASVFLSAFFFMLIMFGRIFLKKITKSNFFNYNKAWYIFAVFIACPIASLGIGFIPGFAQAHQIVAGQNIAYLFATFLFQTINLYVMWFTGLFLPLAHIVHNGIFALGYSFALSIALYSAIPVIFTKLGGGKSEFKRQNMV